MTDTEILKPVRKRRRPAKSCDQCRKRKLKCDRDLPCKPCKRSRQAIQCTYDPDLHSQSRSPVISQESPLAPAQGTGEDIATRTGERLQHSLSVATGKICRTAASGSNLMPGPHLRADTDKTRMFGQSHWMHGLDQLRLLAKVPTHDISITSLRGDIISLVKEASIIRKAIKSQRAAGMCEPIPNLVGTLPAKDLCDQLVENYLRLFEPLFRILHIPSFRTEYDHLWENLDSIRKPFLLQVLMIITIGSIFHTNRLESDHVRGLAHSWIYAIQWWLTGPTERSAMCLDGVRIFCLLIIARQANSLGDSISITTESLLKLAFTLGLHLDPATFPTLTVFQQEMRRRLWATVLEVMIMTSLNSTLPLLISVEDFTCDSPSNIDDCDIDPKTQAMPEPRPDSERTDSSVSLLLQNSLRTRLLAVRKLNNLQPQITYEETINFGNELNQHCQKISRFFQTKSSPNSCASEFHRKFLDSYVRRFSLFISRLFFLQARKDPRYLFARKTCLECCQIISSHANDLQLPSAVTDEFSLLAMRGSGLFKGPLSQDVIVSLGIEISTQLEEEWDSNGGCIDKSDPLIQLSKSNRRPLINILRHIQGQLRQIMALGRPSCKTYIKLAAILAHIDAIESGVDDPKAEIMKALIEGLGECRELLLQIVDKDASSDILTPWTEDTSTNWTDSWATLGFNFDTIDATLGVGMPGILTPEGVDDVGNMLPEAGRHE